VLLLPAAALAQNQPPVADAGPDQTIFLNESVTLQGSATDPDGHPIVTEAPEGQAIALWNWMRAG